MIIIGLTDTLTLMSTTSSLSNDEDINNTLTTTATGLISTATTSVSSPRVHIDLANRYIESLSDQQLVELDRRLEEKELEFTVDEKNNSEDNTNVKVYKKV
jgi:hypothetical protein